MDEILAIVGGTESLDNDIINLSKYRSAATLKPSNIAHKKKHVHPKDEPNDDIAKALEAYSLIDSAIGDTLNKDLMLLSNHRSAALVQTKVTNDDTIDMTKAMGDTLSNDLTLRSNKKSKVLSGEGSVGSVGSVGSAASSKSHRSAVISKDGSLKSLQRNSVSDNTVESSSIGTSKTPSGKKHYITIITIIIIITLFYSWNIIGSIIISNQTSVIIKFSCTRVTSTDYC